MTVLLSLYLSLKCVDVMKYYRLRRGKAQTNDNRLAVDIVVL